MGAAHNGEDDIAFFAADIGYTRLLDLTTTIAFPPDAEGPLPPFRYLVQVLDMSAGATCWVHFTKFEKTDQPVVATPGAAGDQRIPLKALAAFEVNVRKGYNDRIGALVSTGTGKIAITAVSRSE